MLFEVAVVELPNKKEAADGVLEKLVYGPAYIVAKDSAGAERKALRTPEAAAIDIDRAHVLLRPFV